MSNDILDVDEFLDRVQSDKELLFELLDIFIGDFQVKRTELDEALNSKNYEGVEHVAHFLKGSCGNISAKSLRDIFIELEEKGKNKNLDGLEKYLGEIDQLYEELVKYVGELRGTL